MYDKINDIIFVENIISLIFKRYYCSSPEPFVECSGVIVLGVDII